jgi:HEPN domain-containing protein
LLFSRFADKLPEGPTSKQYEFFDKLTAFYIEGRYTAYKRKLSTLLSKEEAENVLRQTREVFAWLLTLKP